MGDLELHTDPDPIQKADSLGGNHRVDPDFLCGTRDIRTRREDSELSLDFRLTSAFNREQMRACKILDLRGFWNTLPC